MSFVIEAVTRFYSGNYPAALIDKDDPVELLHIMDTVRLNATLLVNGIETDPESVTVTLINPSGDELVYTYGSDTELESVSPGKYGLTFAISSFGEGAVTGAYGYRWDAIIDETTSATSSGTFTVYPYDVVAVVRAQDSNGEPLADSLVSIYRGRALVYTGTTDADGEVTVQLPNDDYRVSIRKPGYRFPVSSAFTVSGPTSVSVLGTNLYILVSPSYDLCRLFGYIVNADGTPCVGSIILEAVGERTRAFVVGADNIENNVGLDPTNVGVSRARRILQSRKEDGFWEVDLIQGTTVRIRIPTLGFEKVFQVPEQDTLNVVDVREWPGARSYGFSRDTLSRY